MNERSNVFMACIVACLLSAGLGGCGEGVGLSGDSEQYLTGSGPPDWAFCTVSVKDVLRSGADDLSRAEAMLEQIRQQTGWADLHIVQTETAMKICRGYFRSFSESKAHHTLDQVRNYTDSSGERPFADAAFSALPTVKKEIAFGPAEWDMRRAPGEATLCIGFYVNAGKCRDRLAAAIKEVRKLREEDVEAWYYHGQYRSGVYVGHFSSYYKRVRIGETRSGSPIYGRKFATDDPAYRELLVRHPEFRFYKINGEAEIREIAGVKAKDKSRLVPVPSYNEEILDTAIGL